jgi:hypothetical protein
MITAPEAAGDSADMLFGQFLNGLGLVRNSCFLHNGKAALTLNTLGLLQLS